MIEQQLLKSFLMQKQSLPLEAKIIYSQRRLAEFVEHCDGQGIEPVIAFSGGKDSTVLADIARAKFPWLRLVFVNTGLEFPELVKFARNQTNIKIIRPKLTFEQVVKKHGFPAVSKDVARAIEDLQAPGRENSKRLRLEGVTSDGRSAPSYKLAKKGRYLVDGPKLSARCCDYMKIRPMAKFEKENNAASIVGTMATDSQKREKQYLKNGCNAYNLARIKSTPLAIWTEQDILNYIKLTGLKICSVYGKIAETDSGALKTTGEERTGCIRCGFGACAEQEKTGTNRFIRLYEKDLKLWQFCMRDGAFEVFAYLGLPVVPGQEFRGWGPYGGAK